MERRNFFQLLFGALLAKWLPKRDKARPSGYYIQFVTRNGYVTPPSPLYQGEPIPLGPPNTEYRIASRTLDPHADAEQIAFLRRVRKGWAQDSIIASYRL
jgi:hypothetical protein